MTFKNLYRQKHTRHRKKSELCFLSSAENRNIRERDQEINLFQVSEAFFGNSQNLMRAERKNFRKFLQQKMKGNELICSGRG